MKFSEGGIVAAGCPLGFPDFVQSEADSAADKVVPVSYTHLTLPTILLV